MIVKEVKDGSQFKFRVRSGLQTCVGIKYDHRRFGSVFVTTGTEVVGSRAFQAVNVKCVILPHGLKKICEDAFKYSRLHRIFIPASVDIIENDAFKGCNDLEIFCEGEPKSGWVKGEVERLVHEDMTDAFNFHRSAGAFADRYVETHVETVHTNYNPDNRPVHVNVSRAQFQEILKSEYIFNYIPRRREAVGELLIMHQRCQRGQMLPLLFASRF